MGLTRGETSSAPPRPAPPPLPLRRPPPPRGPRRGGTKDGSRERRSAREYAGAGSSEREADSASPRRRPCGRAEPSGPAAQGPRAPAWSSEQPRLLQRNVPGRGECAWREDSGGPGAGAGGGASVVDLGGDSRRIAGGELLSVRGSRPHRPLARGSRLSQRGAPPWPGPREKPRGKARELPQVPLVRGGPQAAAGGRRSGGEGGAGRREGRGALARGGGGGEGWCGGGAGGHWRGSWRPWRPW